MRAGGRAHLDFTLLVQGLITVPLFRGRGRPHHIYKRGGASRRSEDKLEYDNRWEHDQGTLVCEVRETIVCDDLTEDSKPAGRPLWRGTVDD